MSIVSTATARRGVKSGRYLVRQYGEDGTQYADLPRLPRTRTERSQASVIHDNGERYLVLDDCHNQTTDHVRIGW
jgi:hypothetical protein